MGFQNQKYAAGKISDRNNFNSISHKHSSWPNLSVSAKRTD